MKNMTILNGSLTNICHPFELLNIYSGYDHNLIFFAYDLELKFHLKLVEMDYQRGH
jgi:hypothetical protein